MVVIKDLPKTRRPREKLTEKGPQNLTNTELIAILLGTGSRKQNALKLAEAVIRQFPLDKLSEVHLGQLLKTSGIGNGKATRILAALELGKRIFAPASVAKIIVRSTQEALRECRDIANKKQEYLFVLYLNARHELLQKEIVALGNVNAIRIEPKEIFSHALVSPCASIIVAHNHPSGDPAPSNEDIQFTKRVQEAGEILGIPMLDHLIITQSGYFSFLENKT